MRTHPLDVAAVRTADSLSRRASLVALGGAAVTAVLRPSAASAGKVAKKVKRTCKRQIGQCQSSVASFCAGAPAGCEEAMAPCCASFKGCKAGAVYACIFAALVALEPPGPN